MLSYKMLTMPVYTCPMLSEKGEQAMFTQRMLTMSFYMACVCAARSAMLTQRMLTMVVYMAIVSACAKKTKKCLSGSAAKNQPKNMKLKTLRFDASGHKRFWRMYEKV